MLVEERTNNVVHAGFSPLVCCTKKGSFINGVSFENGGPDVDGNVGSFSANGIRTYKRRKRTRMGSECNSQAEGQLAEQRVTQPNGEVLRSNSCEQNDHSRIDVSLLTQGFTNQLPGRWSTVLIEHITQSLDVSKGGFRGCTQDALASSSSNMFQLHSTSEQTAIDQDSASFCQGEGNGGRSFNSDGPTILEPNNQPTVHVMTELCQRVLNNVLVSENFELLCKLLCENFQGIKVESFSEFRSINSRMRQGTYGVSPTLFHTDIQQVWRKFQTIGREMVTLATGLSDMSRTSFLDQLGGEVNGTCEEGKHEEFNHRVSHSLKSDKQTKSEQVDGSGLDSMCICRLCGEKANGKDYLVCDFCEEIYHVSCIEPPVEEIPPRNWYCANCTTTGITLAHENCVVCERISCSWTQNHAGGDEKEPNPEDMLCNSEEKSVSSMESEENGVQFPKRERIHNRPCKLCECEIEEGQKFRVCQHQFCLYRIYHVDCLTSDQLEYHGPRWYCPSCLCRTCLTDEDDDKIVLCDGCDHAYHMYCLNPPLTSIPKGKWFCKECEKEIQKIRKAKGFFHMKIHERKQRNNRRNGANKVVGGSVDMLLSAAEKLKTEETMATIQRERDGKTGCIL